MAGNLFFRLASDAQLDYVSPVQKMVLETFDVTYSILSGANTGIKKFTRNILFHEKLGRTIHPPGAGMNIRTRHPAFGAGRARWQKSQ